MELLCKNKIGEYQVCGEADNPEIVVLTIGEYLDYTKQITELKRVIRERSNSERGISPKKTRSGYVLLTYDTQMFRMQFKDQNIGAKSIRLLLETPYPLNTFYKDAYNSVIDDLIQIQNQLSADQVIKINSIKTTNQFMSLFKADAKKILIADSLEAQRSGYWALKLYANYIPHIGEDLLKQQQK